MLKIGPLSAMVRINFISFAQSEYVDLLSGTNPLLAPSMARQDYWGSRSARLEASPFCANFTSETNYITLLHIGMEKCFNYADPPPTLDGGQRLRSFEFIPLQMV